MARGERRRVRPHTPGRFHLDHAAPAGPEGWADHTGVLLPGLKPAGVAKIKWIPFKNGPDLSAAISGGSLDLATFGDTPALTAKAKGISRRLVNQSAVGQDTWLFAKENGPTRLADLKGKTIATRVGSYVYRYLVALLQQQGFPHIGQGIRRPL